MKAEKTISGRFTILELLVVAAVLGVLMSLLFPVLTRAKDSAYRVVCMNNARNVAMGYRHHHEDYGYYPTTVYWLDDHRAVYDYVNSLEVFRCPLSDTPQLTGTDDLFGGTDYFVTTEITDIELKLLRWQEENGVAAADDGDDWVAAAKKDKDDDEEDDGNGNSGDGGANNNGHGNNPYDFDPGNPSPHTQELLSAKNCQYVIYGSDSRHNGYMVTASMDDLHCETTDNLSKFWYLDEKGNIPKQMSKFPAAYR